MLLNFISGVTFCHVSCLSMTILLILLRSYYVQKIFKNALYVLICLIFTVILILFKDKPSEQTWSLKSLSNVPQIIE